MLRPLRLCPTFSRYRASQVKLASIPSEASHPDVGITDVNVIVEATKYITGTSCIKERTSDKYQP